MLRATLVRLCQSTRGPPPATAVTRKRGDFARPYRTPDELLADAGLQKILSESGARADAALAPGARVAVLAHLSAYSNEPVASDVLPALHTAEQMVAWYSTRLRPLGARDHAAKLLHATLMPSADAGAVDRLDERIAVDRPAVQTEFEAALPPNVELDARTFHPPDPLGMTRAKKFSPTRLRYERRRERARSQQHLEPGPEEAERLKQYQ